MTSQRGQKPNPNHESGSDVWKQPDYLVDRKNSVTDKITLMQGPDIEAAPAIYQKNKMPEDFGQDVTSMKLNNFLLSDSRAGVILSEPRQLSSQVMTGNSDSRGGRARRGSFSNQNMSHCLPGNDSQIRSNSAVMQSRNQSQIQTQSQSGRTNEKSKRKRNADNLPVAPSSQPSERKRQIVMPVPQFKNNMIAKKTNENLMQHSSAGDNPLDNMSSISSCKMESQVVPLKNPHIPPKTPNKTVIGQGKPAKSEVIYIGGNNKGRSSSMSRDSVTSKSIVNDEIIPVKQQRSTSRGSVKRPHRSSTRGSISSKQKTANEKKSNKDTSVQSPVEKKNYDKVESRIKDLIKKDRSKFNTESGQFSKKNEPEVLDVEYLTEDRCSGDINQDCTFRSKPDRDLSIKAKGARHSDRFSKELSGGHTLEMSRDESRASCTSNTLLNRDEHEQENKIRSSRDHKSTGYHKSENGEGVMSIASKLLNSDILRRFNTNNSQLQERDSHNHEERNSRLYPETIAEETQYDMSHAPLSKRTKDEIRQESKESVRLKKQFFQIDRNSFDSDDEVRKEDFKKEDYELNFNETSRVSSSQFSAFCPNDDMKTFFKREFIDSRANREGKSPLIDQNTIGEISYSSSKLTYGPNSMFMDKKFTGRSYRED